MAGSTRHIEPLLPKTGFLGKTDAEIGIWSAEGWARLTTGYEVVRDNSVAHNGSWSWLVAGDGISKISGWLWPAYVSGTWRIVRAWVRISALPTSSVAFTPQPLAGQSGPLMGLTLQTDGTLIGAATVAYGFPTNASAPLIPGNWHRLEIAARWDRATSYNYANAIFRLDGVEFQRFIARGNPTGAADRFGANVSAFSAPRMNADDIYLNDDTGSSINYWNDGTKPLSAGKTQPSVRSVGATTTNSTTATSIVVNAPPSISSGDLLVMVVEFGADPSVSTITLPTGWTQRLLARATSGTGGSLLVATKPATGSEPGTYTASWSSGSAVRGHAICHALRSADTTNPVIDARTANINLSGDAYAPFPAADLTEGDALILQAVSLSNASATRAITTPSWWGNVTTLADTTNGHALACGLFGQSNGGLFGTDLVDFTSAPNDASTATIAFRGVFPSPTQTLAPTGVASSEAFGTAVATAAPQIGPTGITSAEAVGTPTVLRGPVALSPSGIPSAEAFGTARAANIFKVAPTGIASAEAFGRPLIGIHLVLRPTGIPSAQAFGKPRVRRLRTTTAVITPTGITSRQALGTPTVTTGVAFIRPVGIASAEAIGTLGAGLGRPFILPKPTGAAGLPLMLVRRSGLRH
jgi:hypothetical protein